MVKADIVKTNTRICIKYYHRKSEGKKHRVLSELKVVCQSLPWKQAVFQMLWSRQEWGSARFQRVRMNDRAGIYVAGDILEEH